MQSVVECEPSRFLDEIPANLVQYHEPSQELDDDTRSELFSNLLSSLEKKSTQKKFIPPIVPGFGRKM